MKLPRELSGGRVPVRAWSSALTAKTERQLLQLASQPWVVHHVAAMPDAHVAEGVAVGSVFATRDVIVPWALGGDLGCGVCAVRFDARPPGRDALESILRGWSERIPVGDAPHAGRERSCGEIPLGSGGGEHGGTPMRPSTELRAEWGTELSTSALRRTCEHLIPRHLGTLGGGNHFVELDRAHDGTTWLLVHSGSRGIGGAIGGHHQHVAGAGGLALETDEGRACFADFAWALDFARANRAELVRVAAEVVAEHLGVTFDEGSVIDVHHNFAAREEHFGTSCLVHRKGAIRADAGALAVIPGSMGTASYVVRGLGCDASFCSASHGAGRVMTRREARERIPARRLEHALRRVVHDEGRRASLVEEAPAAYRDIVEVLNEEAELVEPVLRLEPLVVLKG